MFGCEPNNKGGFKQTGSGLKYKYIDNVDGESPELDDIMVLHMCYKTDKDSMLFDSGTQSDSFLVRLVGPTFVGGVEEGFAMMSPGDSAVFKVSADSIFQKTFMSETPSYITPGSEITFYVRMHDL